MTETPETQPVEGAEILQLLRKLQAQTRSSSEQLLACATEVQSLAAGQRNHTDTLRQLAERLERIADVVERAAPLLNSAPARALAGGGVLQMIRGTRRGAGD